MSVHCILTDASVCGCSLLKLPFFCIVIKSNEKRKGKRKEGKGNTQQADCRYHGNKQATSQLSKFYFLWVLFYRRDEGSVRKCITDIEIYHKNKYSIFAALIHPLPSSSTNKNSLNNTNYCHAAKTGKMIWSKYFKSV